MTLLIGIGIYVGLMATALVFFRFVRACDDDMRSMIIEQAASPAANRNLIRHQKAA
jgi:hypothetical protein